MARPAPDPENRALDIIKAATSVFMRKGFRRAQMADIAEEMGVSPGTLYNAGVNKETLFATVILHQFGILNGPTLAARSEDPRGLVDHIKEAVDKVELLPKMAAAAITSEPVDFEVELRGLVEEQFDFMKANGRGVRILEQSATEFPELASVYFGYLRALVIERWEAYLEMRSTSGHLPHLRDTQIAGRSVLEIISWWTIRNPHDPSSDQYVENNIRGEVIDFVIRGLK
jgi:AcrR family transcriptional regulator